jgi:ubiquitin-protein ligase
VIFAKYIQAEVRHLDDAVSKSLILEYSLSDDKREITVEFKGPVDTSYESSSYKVKFILPPEYPFKAAQGFFHWSCS